MDWQQYADYFKDLNLSDIPGFAGWAIKSTLPYDAEGNLHYGINDPVVGKWAAEQLPYAGIGLGWTKIVGAPGGLRTIQSFKKGTHDLIGQLGYRDFPGQGAAFGSIAGRTPRGTAEVLQRFTEEMGPLMDNVKVPGPIKAQSVPAFQSWIDKGRLDQWPNLKERFQNVINQTKDIYGSSIPENTYAWNKGKWGESGLGGWNDPVAR